MVCLCCLTCCGGTPVLALDYGHTPPTPPSPSSSSQPPSPIGLPAWRFLGSQAKPFPGFGPPGQFVATYRLDNCPADLTYLPYRFRQDPLGVNKKGRWWWMPRMTEQTNDKQATQASLPLPRLGGGPLTFPEQPRQAFTPDPHSGTDPTPYLPYLITCPYLTQFLAGVPQPPPPRPQTLPTPPQDLPAYLGGHL